MTQDAAGHPAIPHAGHRQSSDWAPAARRREACSLAQVRLWVLDQIEPGDPIHNLADRWRLDRPPPDAVFDAAWQQVIARHDSLRTSFAENDGEPVRIVWPEVAFAVTHIDLRAMGHAEAIAQVDRLARQAARWRADLSSAPILSVTCVQLRDHAEVLVTSHSIVCDGASFDILAREVSEICAARQQRRPPALPDLPQTYGTYVRQQAELLGSLRLAEAEAEWRRMLQGLTHVTLPLDHPVSPGRVPAAAIVSVVLDEAVASAVAGLARRAETSVFATMLAALLVVLFRQTGETDLVISTQHAGRDDKLWCEIVGPVANTLLLRGDLTGDPDFMLLLSRVDALIALTSAIGFVPSERLIEIVNPKRDLARTALAAVNFNLDRQVVLASGPDGARVTRLPSCPAGALYDLDIRMVQDGDDWRVQCIYAADRFDPATISGLLERLCQVLKSASRTSMSPISAIEVLGDEQRRSLIARGNETAAEYPRDRTLPALFALQAARTPDAIAVACGEATLTYGALHQASDRVAGALRRRGLPPSSRIGLLLDRSPELVVALLGILKAGFAYVPLDPNYPPARLAHIAENARFGALITLRSLAERVALDTAPLLLIDDLAAEAATALADGPSPDDVAYVIYTSGSTGRPKGVQVQHRALVNLLWAMRERPGLVANDVLVAVTTISFDIAALEIFLPLIVGARLVIAQEAQTIDGGALLALLQRHSATVMQATPVTWQMLIEAGWNGEPALKMLCGGEALARPLANALLRRGGALWNMYGPTETTIWSAALLVEPGDQPVPIGPPIANTRFYVLDQHQQLVPPGAPGELYIGGDGLALGYLDLAEMTRERFVADPFAGGLMYRTGDIVRMQPSGRFEYLGRTDQQIKLRGFRIELGEIETTLHRHPEIADAVAVVVNAPPAEAAIHAYVVLRSSDGGDRREALRAWCAQALPVYMRPSSIVILAALPRTPNGKIDRQSLPAPDIEAPRPAGPARRLTEIERRIALIWRDVLGQDVTDPLANFFEIGGHSLLAMRMLARIEAQFSRRIGMAALFKAPTLDGLARLAESTDLRAFDFREVVRLQPGGTRPTLIAINNTGIFFALARHLGRDQPFTALQTFDPARHHAAAKSFEEIAADYVRLIRSLQPQGPYALIGWCDAGTLGFEIGRQLYELHREAPLVVLVDAWAPGYWKRLPRGRAALASCSYGGQRVISAARAILTNYRSWPRRLRKILADVGELVAGLQTWDHFRPRHYALTRMLRTFRRPPDAPAASLPADYGAAEEYDDWLTRYLGAAAARYRPRRYPVKLVVLRAGREPVSRFLDYAMGWSGLAAGGLDVFAVPGNHYSMFHDPGVQEMAAHLRAALGRHFLGGDK